MVSVLFSVNFWGSLMWGRLTGQTVSSLNIIYLTIIGPTFSEKEMLNEWKKHYIEKCIC